jgi:hypothetical protein
MNIEMASGDARNWKRDLRRKPWSRVRQSDMAVMIPFN